MEVEMKIRGLMMDPVTNMPIVVLKDVQGQAILPIWVGVYEANAIALEIEKVQTPRPMTHDLLKNVLLGLEVRVQKIVVNDLKDDTFYALIWVERDGQMMSIDSRPSDALALALRMDCPIYVDELVLKNSKVSSAFSGSLQDVNGDGRESSLVPPAAYQLASKVSCGTRVCSAFLAAFKASPGHQTKNVAKRLLGHLTEALRIRIALRFFHAV